ncbi:MAG: metal ABC transporter permease [Granulosicoccus sp.]|nr:metal ABC transporter permease [Granulosicoccus sp.]
MMQWLLEPLAFEFMQQALIIGLLVTVPSAAMSCLLVLKGWSLMGDAVSHAVLPGIVIAYIAGIPMVFGAFVAGMLCAISTGYLTANSRLKEDTVMGVVFSGMFALGIVLFTHIHTNLHLDQVLFGNLLGVSWRDVLETGALTLVVLAIFLMRQKDILVFAFDPQHAGVVGLNTSVLHYGLLAMLSVLIVASISAVGIILVIAVLIAPGAIAFLLTDRFHHMIYWAMGIAVVTTTTGILLSYHIDSAPAPTIVVLMTLVFVLVFLFTARQTPKQRLTSLDET